MVRHALSGLALPVYGDGQQRRDWLYVVDHCAAIRTVLERGRIGETYNVGGGGEKVPSTFPRLVRVTPDQPQIGFVDQGGGLQGVIAAFLA